MTLFEANKNNLIVRYTELFTSGSAKVYYAEFSFSADWNGFAKIATFRNGSVSKSVAVDEENAFEIPWEVFVNPGTLECGITGTKEDGTTLPTIWATVATIKQGAEIGDEAKEVTPDIYEQLISRLDEGVTQAQNAAERAEAAAINQPYPNQVTGTWWVWNPEAGEYVDSGISSAAYTLPPMAGTVLGGAMADPAQESDTQPVRIGADHKLYTAPGGSASSPDVLCVNLTMGEGNTITADKTFAEIIEAVGSGMCVIARLSSGEMFYLTFYDDTFVGFSLNNDIEFVNIYCDSSDTWSFELYTLTASDVGAIPSPATATVGQTIIVKAVDANGVPTEWEAADMPSGGGSGEGGSVGFEVLVDFTTEEAVTEFTIPETVITPIISKIKDASILMMQLNIPRDETDTSVTTTGTVTINAYVGWLTPIVGRAFNAIIAPSETYNKNWTKNLIITKAPESVITSTNVCLVQIFGKKSNGNHDALDQRTFDNYFNNFDERTYITVVGSQTMAAGTRFVLGVIA